MGAKDKIRNFFSSSSVSVKETLGYSGGIFGNAMGQDSIGTYDDKFCREYMGLDDKMMLVKGNISTVLGFIAPAVAGAWYDTPSKGKMSNIRKALVSMPIPFAISSTLLFIVPTTSAWFNFFWALFLSIVFAVVDAFYDVAMEALGLKICKDPAGRKNFYTISALASTLGSMLPGWIIPIIVGTTDDANRQKWLYFSIALVFCIIGTLSMYAPFMTIKERAEWNMQEYYDNIAKEKAIEKESSKVQWNKQTFQALFHNRPFIILLLSMFFDMIRTITYRTLPYLYENVLDDYGMKAKIDMISGGLSYVGLFLVPLVGEKISARNMLAGGYAYSAIFYLVLSLLCLSPKAAAGLGKNEQTVAWIDKIRSQKWIVGLLIGASGMPNSAQGAARKIITVDSTDYMEWYAYKHFGEGIRSDGIISAADSVVRRLVELLKTNIYNALFSIIKFKSNDLKTGKKAVQAPSTIKGLYMICALCGLIGNLLSALIFLFDNYTGKKKQSILEELNEMRGEVEKEFEETSDVNSIVE